MSAVARIPKPNFYNPAKTYFYKSIWVALGIGGIGGYLWDRFVTKEYTRKVEEFFKTYDPFEDFERMRQLGVFQSAPPDWVLEEQALKKKAKEAKKKKKE